jgi:hypothetical protein
LASRCLAFASTKIGLPSVKANASYGIGNSRQPLAGTVDSIERGPAGTGINTAVLISVLVMGMFLPTSINGQRTNSLNYVNFFIALAVYTVLIFRLGYVSQKKVWAFCAIVGLMILFTLTTSLVAYSLSVGILYMVAGVLFCIDIKNIRVGPGIGIAFIIVNAINIAMGIGMAAHSGLVDDFVAKNYAYFYDQLLPRMLIEGKPVLTFSTHSLAGFYLYVLFYLCLRTYLTKRQIVYLVFALAYLGLCFLLQSSSGYLFLIIGLVVLARALLIGQKAGYVFLAAAALFTLSWFIDLFNVQAALSDAFGSISFRLDQNTSGFNGRYSLNGVLTQDFRYIQNHPFSPIGMASGPEVWLSDSGYMVNWLRGSIALTIAFYGSFYFFVRGGLLNKRVGWSVLSIFLLFEIAFPNLLYVRTLFLLPFAVIYLNYLEVWNSDNPTQDSSQETMSDSKLAENYR